MTLWNFTIIASRYILHGKIGSAIVKYANDSGHYGIRELFEYFQEQVNLKYHITYYVIEHGWLYKILYT